MNNLPKNNPKSGQLIVYRNKGTSVLNTGFFIQTTSVPTMPSVNIQIHPVGTIYSVSPNFSTSK